MKYLYLFLLFTSLSAHTNPLPAYCPEPLAFVYDVQWYPFVFKADDEYKGIDLELLLTITDKMGCPVKNVALPIKRVYRTIARRSTLVVSGAVVSQSRLQYAQFSRPYRKEKISAFYLHSERLPDNLDLAGLVNNSRLIANITAGWYGKSLEKWRTSVQKGKFIHVDNMASRMNMLRRGRVQATIEDHMAGCSYFHLSARDIASKARFVIVNREDVSFMFSKNIHPDFLPLFDRILGELIDQGFVEQLEARYTPFGC
jgi:polar amino acid transport system substrate-binding protein